MKNTLKFSSFAVIACAIMVLSSCDKENPKTYNEADFVGTYKGQHLITDKSLLDIIKIADPTQGGAFDDVIIISNGEKTDDNILEASSELLNTSIQFDISKSSENVIDKRFDSLVVSEKAAVVVKNARVKPNSTVSISNDTILNVKFNMSGTIFIDGKSLTTIQQIPTAGNFIRE